MKVDEEHRRPSPVVGCRPPRGAAHEQVRQRDRHQNAESRCREDAPDPARVEVEDRSPAGRLPFAEQDARDHETRDHEEHVDADVSAPQTGDSGVEEDHEEDGDRPETFDVGTEATITGCGARLQTRGEEPGIDVGLSLQRQLNRPTPPGQNQTKYVVRLVRVRHRPFGKERCLLAWGEGWDRGPSS